MKYSYNLDEIKENLEIEQIRDIVAELGGEPVQHGDILVCKTICHHGDRHKLYYYSNTRLFKCYTDCGDTFDVFELVKRNKDYKDLPQAIEYVAQYFGISKTENNEVATDIDDYLTNLQNYERIQNIDIKSQTVELKTYDDRFLKNFPKPVITPWIEDNITQAAMDRFEIAYDPKNQAVVIPHRDIDGRLIGVRERTLIKENAEKYGKYRPMQIGNKMYNHPLSFSLYGIYQNKDNIKRIRKAIVLEGEKSVLQLDNILGKENNIGVACCGSNLIAYQVSLLMSLGVEEIIVALDRQYKVLNDAEHKKLVRNLKTIDRKYGNFVKITFMFDLGNDLPYKASPSDAGKQIFMKLFRERRNLY
jgi:hypothetical protein